MPSVAAAVSNSTGPGGPAVAAASNAGGGGGGGGNSSGGGGVGDPYASRTSLNHEIAMSSSSRPQSRSHSHHCQQQGCDYPSG